MSDLKERLLNWETVFPCDQGKPEGHLYEEALSRIEELEADVERLSKAVTDVANWLDDPTPHHIGGVKGANAIARSTIRDGWKARIEELEAKLATARNDALEEAALIADRKMEHYAELAYSRQHDKIQNAAKIYCAGVIADAIRALKSTTQT